MTPEILEQLPLFQKSSNAIRNNIRRPTFQKDFGSIYDPLPLPSDDLLPSIRPQYPLTAVWPRNIELEHLNGKTRSTLLGAKHPNFHLFLDCTMLWGYIGGWLAVE